MNYLPAFPFRPSSPLIDLADSNTCPPTIPSASPHHFITITVKLDLRRQERQPLSQDSTRELVEARTSISLALSPKITSSRTSSTSIYVRLLNQKRTARDRRRSQRTQNANAMPNDTNDSIMTSQTRRFRMPRRVGRFRLISAGRDWSGYGCVGGQ